VSVERLRGFASLISLSAGKGDGGRRKKDEGKGSLRKAGTYIYHPSTKSMCT